MSIQTIGLVSTGDMGHAVGRTLREGGFTVLTALDGRSERSRGLAANAGIEDAGDLASLIGRVDLLMSVMPPSAAVEFATGVAALMNSTGATPLFADCNAIAPATSRTIADIIETAGADYIDGGIIGMPPGRKNPPRLYVSGDRPERLEVLARPDMIVRTLDGGVGAASAIKMCYAALNKGAMTLETLVLVGAAQLGLASELRRELADAQPQTLERMEGRVPWLAADAERWSGEMLEIARTFADVGLTPLIHEGAAEIFDLLADSSLASETRETANRSRTIEEAVAAFSASLSARARDAAD
ncbi:MAG: NAD(P)-dependent oxidoreductase [Rhodospirillaceae bacterium]|jgi:3-hydroxyisobutyrate dehydrogenase-like beta-hydroxyacid dehydrogenase|nr:NAD(P)-dependent oxidoreductase [Rhodospirillaceae bacterium]MBT3932353.1 NAD(P)-dependent oxidoreductase [Rhodospirillaceae bacterium]MBT4771216.1 NAD(P)-dependent oxidoreductase [Rhodospirillaceae bacterium]MBT5357060.1 NAD(P)-dependent oxidoreductase [Rhodospirillaceae bacterium]MBT5769238.1 NAD(P)-dependent oxidoreductase [Rhodospirillaceae bacterium]